MGSETIRAWIAEQWTGGLRAAIAAMLSEAPTVRWQPSVAGARFPKDWTWWSQSLTGVSGSPLSVGASPQNWEALGTAVLAVLGLDQPDEADVRGTCRDLVAQSGSALAQQLAQRFQTPVSGSDVVPEDTPAAGYAIDLEIAFPQVGKRIALAVVIGEELVALVVALTRPSQTPAAPGAPPVPQSVAGLQLRVHVTLGKVALLLQDIFTLRVGSVIELGQLVTQPAAVVVNGRVLASGQLVVLNGNYALKVVSKVGDRPGGAAA